MVTGHGSHRWRVGTSTSGSIAWADRASPNAVTWYDHMIRPFLAWAAEEGSHVDPKTLSTMFGNRRRPVLGTVLAVCATVGLGLEDVIVFEADPRESIRSAA